MNLRGWWLCLVLGLVACQQVAATATAVPSPVVPTTTTPPIATVAEATTAVANANVAPSASAPACDPALHDPAQWHGLWNATAGCHYNHEHKHNPHDVDDIFGPPGAWFGGGELSYPWQTFKGSNGDYPAWSGNVADLENIAKHNNYGWIVRRDIPAHAGMEPDGTWIRAFRLQYHGMGEPHDVTARFHSFSLEAEVCNLNGDCGIVRTGGWLDFGNLEIDGAVPLPGEEDAVGDDGRRRIHFFYADPERRAEPGFKAEFFWYGRHRPIQPPFSDVPLDPMLIALAQADVWYNVDPADPHAFNLFCPDYQCNKNGSTIQAHVIQFTVRQSDFNGYTDRYGRLAPTCAAPGLDCVPLILEHVPLGSVQHRDDRDLGLDSAGAQDFDISPAGVWWIEPPP